MSDFPWPGDSQRRDAAQCIRDEYARRDAQRRKTSQDLFGYPGGHIASVPDLTPEDLVNVVLWSLRGQRQPTTASTGKQQCPSCRGVGDQRVVAGEDTDEACRTCDGDPVCEP